MLHLCDGNVFGKSKLGKLKKVNAIRHGVKPGSFEMFDILELTFAIAKIARSAKNRRN
jgi:hypothetical protein